MATTWDASVWQGTNFNFRQAISFGVSVAIIFLLLLIPIKLVVLHKSTPAKIMVKLVKSKPKEKIIPIEKIQKPVKQQPIVKQVKQVSQPKPTKKTAPKVVQIIHRKPKTKQQKQKIIQPQKQLPSSVVLFDSMRNRKKLPEVTDDFKAVTDNQFKLKNYNKSRPQRLVVKNKYADNIHVRETQPMALGILKALVNNYGLHPIDDKEKTQDSLNHCAALGRASVFCPTSNPFAD